MFSTLPMGEGGDTRQKYHQNVKSLIIFARDCRFRDAGKMTRQIDVVTMRILISCFRGLVLFITFFVLASKYAMQEVNMRQLKKEMRLSDIMHKREVSH